MVNFLQFCENATKQLGRQLKEEEVNFLHWMYHRYSEEKQESCAETFVKA
ncbi:hypothetical protein KM885_07305 [Oceanobacillus caeni]|nr:hypothetical protein [Oceanobacillus caeni]MBU8790595.1 hypothetical protein [Oceanobacillus caeni]